jgi:hypothetical protein
VVSEPRIIGGRITIGIHHRPSLRTFSSPHILNGRKTQPNSEEMPQWKQVRRTKKWRDEHALKQREYDEKKRKKQKEQDEKEDKEARAKFNSLMKANADRIAALLPLCSPTPPGQRKSKQWSSMELSTNPKDIWHELTHQQKWDWLVKERAIAHCLVNFVLIEANDVLMEKIAEEIPKAQKVQELIDAAFALVDADKNLWYVVLHSLLVQCNIFFGEEGALQHKIGEISSAEVKLDVFTSTTAKMAQSISWVLDDIEHYQKKIETHCSRADVPDTPAPPPENPSEDPNEPTTIQNHMLDALSDLHRFYRMTALKEVVEVHGQTLSSHQDHQRVNRMLSGRDFTELIVLLRRAYEKFFQLRKQRDGEEVKAA